MKSRESTPMILIVCLMGAGLSPSGVAQEGNDSEVIADIRGTTISRGELEGAVGEELHQLNLDSLRFSALQKRRKYDLLEKQLKSMMSEQLFRLEAEE
ncbi:MAG: hypothetical protein V3R94_10050, partial [Acidobacteriota bacterium]